MNSTHAMSKREILARMLEASGLSRCSEATRIGRGHLTVLAYHRVLDIDSETYPYDEDIVSVSIDEFDWQMRYVKAHFDVVTFADFHAATKQGQLPERPLIVTFDDGYRDNCTHAFPVLRLHDLPATVYLTTGLIGSSAVFWFEKIAFWIKRSERSSFRFGIKDPVEVHLGAQRREALETVQSALKLADEQEHAQLMGQLEEQIGQPLEERHLVEVLSWDEVSDMHRGGIEFGSHSVSHLNLAKISGEYLTAELQDSKRAIESKLGCGVLTVSYPIGMPWAYSGDVCAKARHAGFEFGVSYVDGTNALGALDPFGLKRMHVERDTDRALFRARLAFPSIFTGR
jgi:peptidoglycan/xylan/chitin deacetylase (PgdA/CDA1 family)